MRNFKANVDTTISNGGNTGYHFNLIEQALLKKYSKKGVTDIEKAYYATKKTATKKS